MMLFWLLTTFFAVEAFHLSQSRTSLSEVFEKVPQKYDIISGFFEQDDLNTDSSKYDIKKNFGLLENTTWENVISFVRNKNDQEVDSKYKLFFLARHGEGFHNIASDYYGKKEWKCDMRTRPGNATMEWIDAALTPKGIRQASELSVSWSRQLSSSEAPLPESFYVSPMRRCMETYFYTWKNITNFSPRPIVKEYAREVIGISTSSKRHTKTYIGSRWDYVDFEKGFKEDDVLWSPYLGESDQRIHCRGKVLLNDIFGHDDNEIISLTSHSGLIASILDILNHRPFHLDTGQMLPVVVRASLFNRRQIPRFDQPMKTLEGCDLH